MSDTIGKIEITTLDDSGTIDIKKTVLLNEINKELEKHPNISTSKHYHQAPSNVQGVDPLITIAIANIAISSLTLVWTIVNHRYKGKVTLEKKLANGSKLIITTERLSKVELQKIVENLEQEAEDESIQGLILRLR